MSNVKEWHFNTFSLIWKYFKSFRISLFLKTGGILEKAISSEDLYQLSCTCKLKL